MKVLMTLVLVLLLAGCAAGQGDAGRTTAEENTARHAEETTAYKEETTAQKGAGGPIRPPETTLSYGGQEVKGKLDGSYCWFSGSRGACIDVASTARPRPPKPTLTVPSGSEMVFRYGGQKWPDKLDISATSLDKQDTSTASANPNRSRSLEAHGSGVERTIPVELPPGEYVVSVFVIAPQGDASYSFHVKVE